MPALSASAYRLGSDRFQVHQTGAVHALEQQSRRYRALDSGPQNLERNLKPGTGNLERTGERLFPLRTAKRKASSI